MNKIKNKVFLGACVLIIFTILFILLLHLPIRILIPVYVYSGIASLFFVTIVLAIFLFIIYKKIGYFDLKDCIIIVLLYFSMNIFFFCMVPVTLERSISVFMLNEMNETQKEYTKEEIENQFIDIYVYEYGAFSKRFEEQIYTGTIQEKNGKYKINKKGNKMVKLFKFIKKIYNVKGKLLN